MNLCLYVGPRRDDGLHELVSVVQPLDLADEVTLEPAERDEVVCPGVEGENLALRALRAYRDAAGVAGAHRIVIDKRVPIAAGMGGGSSDAAATLRLAAHAAGNPADPRLRELAPALGADVTALLHETATFVTGAGEEATPIPGPALAVGGPAGEAAPIPGPGPAVGGPAGEAAPIPGPGSAVGGPAGEGARPAAGPVFVVLPSPERLGAAEVYAEADRLGLARSEDELAVRRAEVETALRAGGLPLELVHNDLEPAARSLCPAIDDALAAARAAGAAAAIVTGSGPTVVAIVADPRAAEALAGRWPGAVAARTAPPGLTRVREA